MTAGQQDILRGTYSTTFINRNAQCFTIEAPGLVDRHRIENAFQEMGRKHPVLRMVPVQRGSEWRQKILAPDDVSVGQFVKDDVSIDELQARMDELVLEMIEGFDVFDRPAWGVVQLRTASSDWFVFIFNHIAADLIAVSHFVRTFVMSLVLEKQINPTRDTYLDYLEGLEKRWTQASSEQTQWWVERPWGEIPPLPGLLAIQGAPRTERVDVVDWVHESDLQDGKLSEDRLVRAVEQSVRDIAGVPTTRIDAARVGRNTHIERSAGGWLSHALPFVNTQNKAFDELAQTRDTAAVWISAFQQVRSRPDLTIQDHFSAQVFLNFFGTFNPEKWALAGFRVSRIQPNYATPGRTSLTPFHIKVRSVAGQWSFAWSLSPQYEKTDMFDLLRERTRQLLAVR